MKIILFSLCSVLLLAACGPVTMPIYRHLADSLDSPDGVWRFEVFDYDDCFIPGGENMVYEELILVNVSNYNERLVDEEQKVCGGPEAFGFDGLFWSPDSRYYYYTNEREGVPGVCWYWQSPIIRLDMTTFNKEPIGAGPRSPDGSKIATWQGQEVVVWDINGGEIARLPAIAPDAQIGPIAWSPDSQALVYLQVAFWCSVSGKSYLVLVDLANHEQRLLLESELPTFGNVQWEVAQELRLIDETGKEWCYNLITQELTHCPDQTTEKHRKP